MVSVLNRKTTGLKTVAVGEGGVGKTCMYIRYAKGTFPEVYCPTVFENYSADEERDGVYFTLGLWDTAGGEDYPRLRPLSYPGTNVFLLCYDVSSVFTCNQIAPYWVPELRHHCPQVPIILVATKIDLRGGEEETISTEKGEELAKEIGAACYMEISAKEDIGVKELFQEAIMFGNQHYLMPKKRKLKCFLL